MENSRSKNGFSLVEAMIVLALLALLGAMSFPAFGDFVSKYRVDSAAKALRTTMDLARMKAINENQNYDVTFDSANNLIKIESADRDDTQTIQFGVTSTEKAFQKISLGRLQTVAVPNSSNGDTTSAAAFSPDKQAYFSFRPNGTSTSSGEFFIMPTLDLTGGVVKERIRVIQVSIGGLTRTSRYSGTAWTEFQ